jgi:hypothetical protein
MELSDCFLLSINGPSCGQGHRPPAFCRAADRLDVAYRLRGARHHISDHRRLCAACRGRLRNSSARCPRCLGSALQARLFLMAISRSDYCCFAGWRERGEDWGGSGLSRRVIVINKHSCHFVCAIKSGPLSAHESAPDLSVPHPQHPDLRHYLRFFVALTRRKSVHMSSREQMLPRTNSLGPR